jgi:hypothetical protein
MYVQRIIERDVRENRKTEGAEERSLFIKGVKTQQNGMNERINLSLEV